jgi:hypothetical protein
VARRPTKEALVSVPPPFIEAGSHHAATSR